MLVVSVILFCLVGVAMIAMGYKYISATPPMDYHAEILSAAPVTDEFKLILGALYKAMGGAFAALGVATILIALTGLWNDVFMAKLTLLAMAGISASFAILEPKKVEVKTGVKTPWRIAAGLLGISLLAFVLSLI